MKYHEAKILARSLRKNQTQAEIEFWNQVRNRRFCQLKFTRQFPIPYNFFGSTTNYFIVDFYCNELKLIVEIDGDVHQFQKEFDAEREKILKKLGVSFVRFSNSQVLDNWLEVEQKLYHVISTHP